MKTLSLTKYSVVNDLRRTSGVQQEAFQWQPGGGKRRRGRPKATWKRSLEAEMKASNLSWNTIRYAARDRSGWKRALLALCVVQVLKDSKKKKTIKDYKNVEMVMIC
ncbi:jg23053 [Pararge aegeria aegeria]|uniref:Jg23053 protein n=1 Tax=Pararge aegeria aegeria TaxID=348720 RepID=A0A8S4S4G7_9NEOP|nr:jg23053 [Pararge aegeria aegeria]